MVRIRSGWIVALASLGLVTAAACKKDDKKDQPAAADKATDKDKADTKAGDKDSKAAPGGGAADSQPLAAIGGQIGDDLALLPKDSEIVVGVNFAQIQGSGLWKENIANKIKDAPGVDKFKALCGFDPFESLKSMAIGVKNIPTDKNADPKAISAVVVIHGYDKTKAMACFDKDGIAEVEKDGSKVKMEGDTALITDKSGVQMGFTFVNDNTALAVVGSDAASKDSIKKVASGDSALKSSKAFVEMYNKIDSTQSIWAVVNAEGPSLSKAMGQMGSMIHPKRIFGSLNITDGLSLDLRVRVNSPDEAQSLVSLGKGQVDQVKKMGIADKVELTADGADLKVSFAMSHEKLKMVQQMAAKGGAGLLGGLGGMGGP